MDKLLPIKVFEKRKFDEQLTEPGGSVELPKWVLHGEALNQRSIQLIDDIDNIEKVYKKYKQEKYVLPMVIVTSVDKDAIAKTHRGQIIDCLNSDNNNNIIGVDSNENGIQLYREGKENEEGTREILSLITTDELIVNIRQVLKDVKNSQKLISSITKLKIFEASIVEYNNNNKVYRVMLIDYADNKLNQFSQQYFKDKCKESGIKIVKETRYYKDMKIYRVVLDSLDDMEKIQKFEGISFVEEAIPVKLDVDIKEEAVMPSTKQPKQHISYPVVGVLDSGIERNQYLSPWIIEKNETYYPIELQNKNHGSMVASILEYSDEMNGTKNTSIDGVMMLEVVAIPDINKEIVYIEDIVDNVRDAIQRHKEIKIWTMSIGTEEEAEINTFSKWGMALDDIADENNVLIIKSAGNSKAYLKNKKTERISKMADSVRALVVGSIANEKSQYDIADINKPSPFTRCGPGPSHIIKPDLVAYGGNAGILPDGNNTMTGVKVIDSFGNLKRAAGTSFSTPWIARIASELDFLLEGNFDPLLIKALMVHNAIYPAGEKMIMEDKKKFMGFGMPNGTKDILYNSEHEITLILRDSLKKGTFIDILDFPFPKSLIGDDGCFRGQIILTMVNSPILMSTEGPEYCQSDIQVKFGTMDGIKERDISKHTIRNLYGPDKNQNLMSDKLYKSNVFNVIENNVFGKERTLLEHGQKFYPIKKYAVDLDEMKNANRNKFLVGNRKWYMKIEALFRDAIERKARITGEELKQDFCVLLTIKDPKGKAPIYNEVTQQLQEKNFIYSNVKLKNEIREYINFH